MASKCELDLNNVSKNISTNRSRNIREKNIAYNKLAMPYEIPSMVSFLLSACNNEMPLVFLRVHPPYRC